jgi:RsiW-degrading membrane proteinase PrsW (M82 family)
MTENLIDIFISGFIFPGILWNQVLVAIVISVLFGAVWFIPYWTPIFKNPWVCVILVVSASLTWAAIAFVQGSLQHLTNTLVIDRFSRETFQELILYTAIPSVLFSGLVQEGAKLLPVVIFWWRRNGIIEPKLGLVMGAVAGLGFGVFEAVGLNSTLLIKGWSWEVVQSSGLSALIPFWERFSAVGIHVSLSALAGYGLARGWGWQFYILASLLHASINYSAILIEAQLATAFHSEVHATACALAITGYVLWLRWRKGLHLDLKRIQTVLASGES